MHFGTGAKIRLQPEQISIVIVAANLFLSWTSVKFDCNSNNIQSLKRRPKRDRRSRHLVPSLDGTECKKHRNFNSNTELHGCGFYDWERPNSGLQRLHFQQNCPILVDVYLSHCSMKHLSFMTTYLSKLFYS